MIKGKLQVDDLLDLSFKDSKRKFELDDHSRFIVLIQYAKRKNILNFQLAGG